MALRSLDDPDGCDDFFDCEEHWVQNDEEMLPPAEPAPEPSTEQCGNDEPTAGVEAPATVQEAILPEAEGTTQPATTAKHALPVEPTADVGMPAMKLRRVGLSPKEADAAADGEAQLTPFQRFVNGLKVEHTEEVVTKHFWNHLTGSQAYNYLYDKLRGFYATRVHPLRLECQEGWGSASGKERQKMSRKAFQALTQDEKSTLAQKWLEITRPPKYVVNAMTHHFKPNERQQAKRKERCKGMLLTWILPDTVLPGLSLPPAGTRSTLNDLVTFLRSNKELRDLWDKIRNHGQACLRLAGGSDVAISFEICPDTWEQQQHLRLHVHCFVLNVTGHMTVRMSTLFNLCDVAPNVSSTDPEGNSVKGRNLWSGFFYCCLPQKRGTVCCDSTKAPFTGFRVNPNWIMCYVQGGKLHRADARKLLVRCGSATRLINELDKTDMELEREAIEKAQAEATRLLGAVEKPPKAYPKVQAFLNQFKVPRHRYKFLVLSGPSRLGKTAFARTLCDADLETLEINCAGGAEPDLRAYRLRKHGLVLFDEIKADQVAAQRKLFQAGSSEVQMGCSATNCHSYPVFLWRKKLVLASNNWHETVASLPPDATEWIKCNCIVLDVKERMWIE